MNEFVDRDIADTRTGKHFKTRAVGQLFANIGHKKNSVIEIDLHEMQFANTKSMDQFLKGKAKRYANKGELCNLRKLNQLHASAE